MALSRSVWVIKCLSFFLVSSQSSSTPLYLQMLRTKECVPQPLTLPLFSLQIHIWIYQVACEHVNWSITNDTHCYTWQELKLYIFIEELNLSFLHKTYWDSSSFNVKNKIKMVLSSWYIVIHKYAYKYDWPRHFLLTNMNNFDTWKIWSNV